MGIGVSLLDAIVLSIAARVLGLVIREELSINLFRSNPGYARPSVIEICGPV
jgi:hypothetical protein